MAQNRFPATGNRFWPDLGKSSFRPFLADFWLWGAQGSKIGRKWSKIRFSQISPKSVSGGWKPVLGPPGGPKTPRNVPLPLLQPLKYRPNRPPNGVKSGQNALFRPFLSRYWVNFAQTPKVGAPPASRTCFHRTRQSKNAIFAQFSANLHKIGPQTGYNQGSRGPKIGEKWSKNRFS